MFALCYTDISVCNPVKDILGTDVHVNITGNQRFQRAGVPFFLFMAGGRGLSRLIQDDERTGYQRTFCLIVSLFSKYFLSTPFLAKKKKKKNNNNNNNTKTHTSQAI